MMTREEEPLLTVGHCWRFFAFFLPFCLAVFLEEELFVVVDVVVVVAAAAVATVVLSAGDWDLTRLLFFDLFLRLLLSV